MSASQKEVVEQRLKQVHEYNRHIAQLIVTWFAFFVTVNYAVMGWLLISMYAVKPVAGSSPHSHRFLPVITVLFAIQNLLGIYACGVVRSHLLKSASLVHQIEASLSKTDTEDLELPHFQTVPVDVYGRAISLMAIALELLVVAWLAPKHIGFTVQGFRVHWGWGLANLLLCPFAGIVFFIGHRNEGRVPIYILAYGVMLLLMFLVCAII